MPSRTAQFSPVQEQRLSSGLQPPTMHSFPVQEHDLESLLQMIEQRSPLHEQADPSKQLTKQPSFVQLQL